MEAEQSVRRTPFSRSVAIALATYVASLGAAALVIPLNHLPQRMVGAGSVFLYLVFVTVAALPQLRKATRTYRVASLAAFAVVAALAVAALWALHLWPFEIPWAAKEFVGAPPAR